MTDNSDCKYLFKFILIGASGVGKTCLMNRFTDEIYENEQQYTIGVDFKIKTILLDGLEVKIHIWDTAGQEKFRAIISNYYRGAHGILVVFDMTNKESFMSLNDWIKEVRKNTKENVEILILGNKIDNETEICVSDEEIEKFLADNDINKDCFIKTSAKEDVKVNYAFETLTRKLVEKVKIGGFFSKTKESFKLKTNNEGGKCCM
ncbi:ras-related protein rab-1b [Vairimorpha apis BRL 01]|uniref:Ras-related protein rab-1b n=1 Tax=Vairimorpha apis BRL 01 TaxID=1037528 RepID=T0MER4_9MICR|nr:ras-related protein rab-1b [Vairimorpha apis BRL 01]